MPPCSDPMLASQSTSSQVRKASRLSRHGQTTPSTVDQGSEHERYWWDITTTYLDYVVDTLGQWRSHHRGKRVDLIPFHEWRRDEDANYHARHRASPGGPTELGVSEHKPSLVRGDQTPSSPEGAGRERGDEGQHHPGSLAMPPAGARLASKGT